MGVIQKFFNFLKRLWTYISLLGVLMIVGVTNILKFIATPVKFGNDIMHNSDKLEGGK